MWIQNFHFLYIFNWLFMLSCYKLSHFLSLPSRYMTNVFSVILERLKRVMLMHEEFCNLPQNLQVTFLNKRESKLVLNKHDVKLLMNNCDSTLFYSKYIFHTYIFWSKISPSSVFPFVQISFVQTLSFVEVHWKTSFEQIPFKKRHLNTCFICFNNFCWNRVVQMNDFNHLELTSFKHIYVCFQALTIARNGPITIALYSARFENCANGMEQLQVKQKNERIANIIYFYEQFMNNFK